MEITLILKIFRSILVLAFSNLNWQRITMYTLILKRANTDGVKSDIAYCYITILCVHSKIDRTDMIAF